MARLAYAIIAVSDMQRSTDFYRDLLSLEPEYESPEWTSFKSEGTSLALHIAGGSKPPSTTEHPAGTAWISFAVDDVHTFHKQALGRGVRCLQEPRDEGWGINANYIDPDGFIFSVATMKEHGE